MQQVYMKRESSKKEEGLKGKKKNLHNFWGI